MLAQKVTQKGRWARPYPSVGPRLVDILSHRTGVVPDLLQFIPVFRGSSPSLAFCLANRLSLSLATAFLRPVKNRRSPSSVKAGEIPEGLLSEEEEEFMLKMNLNYIETVKSQKKK